MSHNAVEQSLAARIRSLSLAPDLRDILAELAERTEPPPAPAEVPHAGEFEQMLGRARGGAALSRGAQHAKPCHLRVIRGGLAAFLAAVAIAWRWAWKSGAHQAAATAVTAAMVGAAAVPVAVSVLPYSAPMTPAGSARHLHADRHPAPRPDLLPAVVQPARRRRGQQHHHAAHHQGADVDSTPSASPSPADTDTPTPAPSGSGSGTGTPTPSPSPTSSTGGPLAGPPWPNMLQHATPR